MIRKVHKITIIVILIVAQLCLSAGKEALALRPVASRVMFKRSSLAIPGFIFGGDQELVVAELNKQKEASRIKTLDTKELSEEDLSLWKKINHAPIVERAQTLLTEKIEKLAPSQIRAIELALEDIKSIKTKKFGVFFMDAALVKEEGIVKAWCLGANTNRPEKQGKKNLGTALYKRMCEVAQNEAGQQLIIKGFFRSISEYAIFFVREVVEAACGDTLCEYVLHRVLCPYLGHKGARETLEILFEDTNYYGETRTHLTKGTLRGALGYVLSEIISGRKVMHVSTGMGRRLTLEQKVRTATQEVGTPPQVRLYGYREPLEDVLAAREQQREIELQQIKDALAEIKNVVLNPDENIWHKRSELLKLVRLADQDTYPEATDEIAKLIHELVLLSPRLTPEIFIPEHTNVRDELIQRLIKIFPRVSNTEAALQYFREIVINDRTSEISIETKKAVAWYLYIRINELGVEETLNNMALYFAEHFEDFDFALILLAERGNDFAKGAIRDIANRPVRRGARPSDAQRIAMDFVKGDLTIQGVFFVSSSAQNITSVGEKGELDEIYSALAASA